MNLANEILNELNNVDSLVSSELTAADVVPNLPRGKYIKVKKTVTGVCDLCNRWDGDLNSGVCDWCNRKYGVKA